MKITITTGLYAPEIGGPATYTALLEKEMPKLGYEINVLAFRQSRHLPKVIRHIHFFFLSFKAALKSDILFAQDVSSVGFPSLIAAKLTRTSFYVRVPGDYAWEQSVQRFGVTDDMEVFQKKQYGLKIQCIRYVQYLVTRFADVVITPSEYFKSAVEGWGVSEEKIHTIYNGVDFVVQEHSIHKPNPLTLVTSGRMVIGKGFAKVIEMMQFLPDWHLVILGDGPEKENLFKITQDLSLTSRVHFMGMVTRDEVFSWCKTADAFILNTYFENLPYQIVEALYAEVPVITTNVGGIPELITSGEEGLLIEVNNIPAMTEAVKSTISEKSQWSNRTRKGKNKAEKFSIDRMIRTLDALILEQKI
jgi:glycosyltransferase involved in cell wall biosynthesis